MKAVVHPASPTTKDACRDGGWETFPALVFRNQGDCIAYLMANERAGKR